MLQTKVGVPGQVHYLLVTIISGLELAFINGIGGLLESRQMTAQRVKTSAHLAGGFTVFLVSIDHGLLRQALNTWFATPRQGGIGTSAANAQKLARSVMHRMRAPLPGPRRTRAVCIASQPESDAAIDLRLWAPDMRWCLEEVDSGSLRALSQGSATDPHTEFWFGREHTSPLSCRSMGS